MGRKKFTKKEREDLSRIMKGTQRALGHDGRNAGRSMKIQWDNKHNKMVFRLALLGCTNKEIAKVLDIGETTFKVYMEKFPIIRDLLKRGREEADARVAERLYKRALGFRHKTTELKVVTKAGKNAGSEVVAVEVVKQHPPDTLAASLWLRNRKSSHWKAADREETPGGDQPVVWNETKTYEK